MKLKYPGVVCDTPRPHHSETPLTVPPLPEEKPSPSQERSHFPTSNLYLAGNQHPNPTWSGEKCRTRVGKRITLWKKGRNLLMCLGTRLGCIGENGLGELGQGRWGSPFQSYGFECVLSGGMTAAFAVCCFG